jgi:DNA-directed RNA polymerase specialized sigma24 family protein
VGDAEKAARRACGPAPPRARARLPSPERGQVRNDEEMVAFFDAHAAPAVAARVRALVASGRVPRRLAADFTQELTTRVWARLGKYDPARSPPRSAACWPTARPAPSSHREGPPKRDPGREVAYTEVASADDEARQRDMALDIEVAIASLRPRQRRLVDLLRTESVTDAAEALGIHRSTAHEEIARTRLRFEALGLAEYLD